MRRFESRIIRQRRGLAPLELVLAIPILLFVLALSVIFGAVACWKVRGEVVARDAIFGRRWPRGGPEDPQATEWRVANAVRSDFSGPQLAELDQSTVFSNPLIRGPLPNDIGVVSEMLDPKNHQRVGNARLTRDPAALARLGPFTLNVRQPLLDGKWQFWQLGYAFNGDRRLRRLYDLLNAPGTEQFRDQYAERQQVTLEIYNRPELFVLDRDEELIDWYGWPATNFHPRIQPFCSMDHELVREQYVKPVLRRIDRVPHAMATRFLRMYEEQLRALPHPPPAAKQAELELNIKILKDFLARLN